MGVQLEGLRWQPRWISHLGCLKGCLGYLGRELSWGWLYGGWLYGGWLCSDPLPKF